jgi:RNA recognition motif-containing protein
MAATAIRGPPPSRTSTKVLPTYAPNQTLYITNLPSSKIQKADLRISLYTLFSTYGPVIDVVALRTMKMRGQAHIVYRDIQTATQAMRALQGFEFFGLELVCALLSPYIFEELWVNRPLCYRKSPTQSPNQIA